MTVKSRDSRQYATKDPYRQLLFLVGANPTPMSSYQIKHRMRGSSSYIYKMIRKLCPPGLVPKPQSRLFNWNRIPSDWKGRVGIVKRVIETFGIDSIAIHEDVEALATKDGNSVTFLGGSSHSISFNRNPRVSNQIVVTVLQELGPSRTYTLPVEIDASGDVSFVASNLFAGERFLTPSSNNPNNLRTWRYSLNFRGFMLYLASESSSDETRPKQITSNKKLVDKPTRRAWRIKRVISNPEIIKLAPFLANWQAFHEVNFRVIDLLLAIGREFESQLDYSEDYLIANVTKRYFAAVSQYFGTLMIGFDEFEPQLQKILNDYKQRLFLLRKEVITNELELIDRWLLRNPKNP